MPLYDFHCNNCQVTFEVKLSLGAHEETGGVVCSPSGSRSVKQLIADVTVSTGRKS